MLISDVAGTTTDPISKSMELLPLGPVLFVDTAGLDDEGELGLKRVNKSYEALRKCDLALFVLDASRRSDDFSEMAREFLKESRKRNMPTVVVINKCANTVATALYRECFDIPSDIPIVCTDALSGSGIEDLKQVIIKCAKQDDSPIGLTDGIVKDGDVVLLVTPIDSAAPKGRLILPQQQVIRDILDKDAMALVVKETEVKAAIASLGKAPDIVITDSQAFKSVANDIPSDMPLTSFSIIFARQKGDLAQQLKGARALATLEAGDRVLISEGCTHHRQCNDIGTVKIPKLVRKIQPDAQF
ncbi:[FeFe] hydrogenase H-cluster maturation GTPase HydF, partial [Mogibacterium pumilum]